MPLICHIQGNPHKQSTNGCQKIVFLAANDLLFLHSTTAPSFVPDPLFKQEMTKYTFAPSAVEVENHPCA